MNVYMKIKPNHQIRAIYLFFLIVTLQTGVGVLTISRNVFTFSEQDSWLSILLAFVGMLIIVLVMLYILRQYESTDIFGIQIDLFGKFIGKVLGVVYIVYFSGALLSVLSAYIQIVQVFIYPTLPSFIIALLILLLVVYASLGDFKVIVGITFIFFFLTQSLFLLIYYPVVQIDWNHFFPMLQTPLSDLLKGAKSATYSLSGFEFIFLFYPLINDKKNIKLPIILGISYTAIILLITSVITIGYFSLKDLEYLEWPALTLYKSITFSFIERIDYMVVVEWMMIIVPNNILYMWGITYGVERLFNVPKKKTLFIAAIFLLICASFLDSNLAIHQLTKVISIIAFCLVFIYPLILLPIVFIKKRILKSKGSAN